MIVLRLDRVLADRKMRSKELAERIGLSEVNLSRIKCGKISAVRFSTLDAICPVTSSSTFRTGPRSDVWDAARRNVVPVSVLPLTFGYLPP